MNRKTELKSVEEIIDGVRVILRIDTDLPMEGNRILDNKRLVKSIPTIQTLLKKKCKVLIIGHRGRPNIEDNNYQLLSLKPVYVELISLLQEVRSVFIDDIHKTEEIDIALANNDIVFIENIRFWPGEEKNDHRFLENIVNICQAYVNDAFSVAHRQHRSIMLFKSLPNFYGKAFIDEAEKLIKLSEAPNRPILLILGGAKEDKLKYLNVLSSKCDRVLVGGRLPAIVDQQQIKNYESRNKIVVAKLRDDGLDLGEEDIELFKTYISQAGTVIWAGAMGLYENQGSKRGTEEIAKAIAQSKAYKIIAGGDTGSSIKHLGLEDKIDYQCSGGGVILEYLAKEKLAAWE